MRHIIVSLLAIFISAVSHANVPAQNTTAIGQGIAAPNVTSLVNAGRGFLDAENPAGVMYQDNFRISGEVAKDGVTGYGAEAGGSNQSFGLAVGAFNQGCSGCQTGYAGDIGVALGDSVDLGGRYQSVNNLPTYGLGLLIMPKGTHRFGLHAEYFNPSDQNTAILNYGAGYAYVDNDNTVNIDASQQHLMAPGATQPTATIASVGYQRRVQSLEASLVYEWNTQTNADTFWIGVGFKGDTWHLAVYADYVSDAFGVISVFF